MKKSMQSSGRKGKVKSASSQRGERGKKKKPRIPLTFKTTKEMDDYLENNDLGDLFLHYGVVKSPLLKKAKKEGEVSVEVRVRTIRKNHKASIHS